MYWALRHDPRKYTIAHCYRRVVFEAKKRNWHWFNALVTCGVWDHRTRDTRTLVLNREGEHAYAAKVGSYHRSGRIAAACNMETLIDHVAVELWHPDRGEGRHPGDAA